MAKIAIPPYLLWKIEPGSMQPALFDVELIDGRVYRRLLVQDQHFIGAGNSDARAGGGLPFGSLDICNIQRHAFAFGQPGAF